MSRFVQIGFVWLGCAVAWVILGSTLVARSGDLSGALTTEVHQLWGPPLEQKPPLATFTEVRTHKEITTVLDGHGVPVQSTLEKEDVVQVPIALVASHLNAALMHEQRKKGLLWFPTYSVQFDGRYAFENRSGQDREVTFVFPIEQENAGLDGFAVRGPKGEAVDWKVDGGGANWTRSVKKGERLEYVVAFHTRGTTSWKYLVTHGTGETRDFHLALTTNFANVDFPTGSLSPTHHAAAHDSWKGEWSFESLITGASVGVLLPQQLNPGPLAARITYFAPVGLLFFFFVIALLADVQNKSLHPMHYFFIGCAFFAFHLLFAYLADHLSLEWLFGISSAVSIFLVVSYARLFVGWRFALREMGIAQLLYLVLFSMTFLVEGYTGLAITCGAIATLFVMMQVTGRRRYATQPSRPPVSPRSEPASGL